MTAILSYRMKHDCHTLLLKSGTKKPKMSYSLPHFLLETATLNFYLHFFEPSPRSERVKVRIYFGRACFRTHFPFLVIILCFVLYLECLANDDHLTSTISVTVRLEVVMAYAQLTASI